MPIAGVQYPAGAHVKHQIELLEEPRNPVGAHVKRRRGAHQPAQNGVFGAAESFKRLPYSPCQAPDKAHVSSRTDSVELL